MARGRTALLIPLVASSAFMIAGPGTAHQGEVVFPIYELSTADLPDLHDRTLEDWEAVLPNASLTQNDFIWSLNIASSVSVEDLAFRVFLAWHGASQKIYMGIERIDDIYLPFEEGSAGNGRTSLMVDGDHSGGKYWFFEQDGYSEDESKSLFGAQAQEYVAEVEAPEDRTLRVASWATWANEPPWADIGTFQQGESPNYSVVELAVTAWDDLDWRGPELSRRSVLRAGRFIGFNVVVMDFDIVNTPDGTYRLGRQAFSDKVADGSFSHSGFAENFVDGELIPCNHGDCGSVPDEPTAVRLDSWGRIKAGLSVD